MQPLFLFKILGIPFFSYTTLTITGVALALIAATHQVRQAGRPARLVAPAFAWIAPPALIAGRIAHVAYNGSYFVERPADLLRFADGGLAFVGVFCGGLVGFWLWARWQRIAFWEAADLAALPLAMLAACAWLGAFMYGSQYGAPTENALALELRDTFGVTVARWPTQMLASAWSALIGLGLLWQSSKTKARGVRQPTKSQGAWFLLTYSIGLFLLDFSRGDQTIYILGLRLSQCLYLVCILAAVFNLGSVKE